MFLDCIVRKYRVKNTLFSMVFCLLCINEEQWCFASQYLTPFNFHRINFMEQRGVCDRLKEIPLQNVENHV